MKQAPPTFRRRTRVELSTGEVGDYCAAAVEFAIAAGSATLPHFRQNAVVSNKHASGGYDPVTEADRAAELAIRELIEDRFPDHGIFGEEHGYKEGNGLTWIIDPIDGTRAFIAGMLHWGVLVALNDGQSPVLGVMYQPFTEELFVGANGAAEYRRGSERRQLRVRPCAGLHEALLASTGPDMFKPGEELEGFDRVRSAVRLTRFGGDCYLYGMLAMGQVDLSVESELAPYDIQALIPIIEGAGGIVSTWSGEDPGMGGRIVASGDARVHRDACRLLEKANPG